MLYKKDKKGNIREWEISVDGNIIVTSHGIQDMEKTEKFDFIEEGKAGRTVEEQIDLVVNSKITVKKNNGYVENIEDAGDSSTNQLGFYRPMLAVDADYSKIDYRSCYVQRKFNGHRCLITSTEKGLIAYSRGGQLITSIPHIIDGLSLPMGCTMDGELYNHDYSLQKISSLVRTENKVAENLFYVPYDMIDTNNNFATRYNHIQNCIKSIDFITRAMVYQVSIRQEIIDLYKDFLDDGYEGVIIRHGNSGYKIGQRSASLMRAKQFDDDEFIVIDIEESVDGWAILICETELIGKTFRVSAPGSHKQKKQVWACKDSYIGEMIKVKFAYYSDDLIPVQPVAMDWLKDISL